MILAYVGRLGPGRGVCKIRGVPHQLGIAAFRLKRNSLGVGGLRRSPARLASCGVPIGVGGYTSWYSTVASLYAGLSLVQSRLRGIAHLEGP